MIIGTLETLSDPQRTILENVYDVKFKTIMPSIYGINNLKFELKDDVLIETEENHYKVICQDISRRINGKIKGTKRAVFVFFENKKELYKFYNSDAFIQYKAYAAILTEGYFLFLSSNYRHYFLFKIFQILQKLIFKRKRSL